MREHRPRVGEVTTARRLAAQIQAAADGPAPHKRRRVGR